GEYVNDSARIFKNIHRFLGVFMGYQQSVVELWEEQSAVSRRKSQNCWKEEQGGRRESPLYKSHWRACQTVFSILVGEFLRVPATAWSVMPLPRRMTCRITSCPLVDARWGQHLAA